MHILQGLKDPDVPHSHALKLASLMPADDVTVADPDGDHRLSRPQDHRCCQAVEAMIAAMILTVSRRRPTAAILPLREDRRERS